MMNSEEITSYLSNIEEYIFDEKKIVTYSWLSKSFGIHANLSKQLLHTFFESNPKKGELSVTYLLIGLPYNGEAYQVSIVKDTDLDDVENTFKTITSKHIYSIQKCLELSDINVLYTAEKDASVDNISKGISAIDFNCNERDNALLAKLKCKALPVLPNQAAAGAKKNTSQAPTKAKSPIKTLKNEQTNKNSEGDKECNNCNLKSENKRAVIPSMFKNTAGPKKKTAEKAVVNSKKPQGIGAFFSKTTKPINESKNAPEKLKEENKASTDISERLLPLKENKATLNICTENKTGSKKDDPHQESPTPVKPKKSDVKTKTSKKADTKRGKKSSAKKVEKESKKRKRLVVLSDSDSNNSSGEEEEVFREPTPEPEPTIVPDDMDTDDIILGTPEPTKKRKKKKLISKTFMSSDGFMVTEKQYVDESCSEDEETVPEKKFKESPAEDGKPAAQANTNRSEKPGKSSAKGKKESTKSKNPSPQKTKQASLMNFFKKK